MPNVLHFALSILYSLPISLSLIFPAVNRTGSCAALTNVDMLHIANNRIKILFICEILEIRNKDRL